MKKPAWLPLVALVVALGALAGCGVGSGLIGTSTTPPTPQPPPEPPSESAMSAQEMQLALDALAAMNAHRESQGLGPFAWYAVGAEVAFAHCTAMDVGDFFAHIDPYTDTDPATRALDAGITHDPQGAISPHSGNPFVGENIAAGTNALMSGQSVVDAWIASPGHHTQIDAPDPVAGAQTMPAWTHCAIGCRLVGSSIWWTAMFFRNPN